MPLLSVVNGAKQCQVLTKRTKQQCKNPAAYGCTSCRMHGAHKSRNSLKGQDHPKYINGNETVSLRAKRSEMSRLLLYLRDMGDSIGMFSGTHQRGRKPKGYLKRDLDNPENLIAILIETLKK